MTLLHHLRSLALEGLSRMYLPEERLFVFRLRGTPDGVVAEGRSRRYTAIALIGLATESESNQRAVLQDDTPAQVYDRLLTTIDDCEDLGDVALTAWAGTALSHPGRAKAFARLGALAPADKDHETVDVAWALTALTLEGAPAREGETPSRPTRLKAPGLLELRDRTAGRLLRAYQAESHVFPHRTGWPSGIRGHVACFADLVYPIQALATFHLATASRPAIQAARACGDMIARRQGAGGQWWWHYDARTGLVVETYPVYSVHQHAMAPMALHVLEDASGADYTRAIMRGLRWLEHPAEMPERPLYDEAARLCWRKIARREPRRLSRALQAAASRVHPALRVPGLDVALPPREVDRECRPYELGWLLHAWPAKRVARMNEEGRS